MNARVLGGATCSLGLVLVSSPGRVGQLVAGRGHVPSSWITRMLGVRYLVQGTAQLVRPGQAVLAPSAAVDLLHGGTMLALAAGSSNYRRPAVISACVAAASAVLARRTSRRLTQ